MTDDGAERTPLTLIGYWLGPHAPGWPDARDFVDPAWDVNERDQIASYLEHGTSYRYFMGLSECRFCGKRVGSVEYTDGTFVWPEGLAHYVVEHHVRLPARFVDHAIETTETLETRPVDQVWWAQQTGATPSTNPPESRTSAS